MKRALYSLDDEEFMTLLERTDGVLRSRNIPYMYVGGVATQAHIINYICKKEGTTLCELAHSNGFRIQDHLRATDDADITLDTRGISDGSSPVEAQREVMDVLREIEGEGLYTSPTSNHLVAIKLDRPGVRRPVFRLGLDTEAESPDSEVSFNLYYGPEDTNTRWPQEMMEFERQNYFDFFNTAKRISIPYCPAKNVDVNVKGIEQLLATKIARAREKDWTDLLLLHKHSLEAGEPINLDEVQKLLSAEDPKYHVPSELLMERFEKFRFLIK